jgi:hypothetical protein
MAEREYYLTVATGQQATGKTQRTKQEFASYHLPDPANGRYQGKKVLIFDVNGEYEGITTLDYDVDNESQEVRARMIKAFAESPQPGIRRILPYRKNGLPMALQQLRIVSIDISTFFKNGMVLYEDVVKYLGSGKQTEFLGMISTVRHKGVDVMMHLQSLGMIPTDTWRNLKLLRMHKDEQVLQKIADRVKGYPMVYIGQEVISARFREGIKTGIPKHPLLFSFCYINYDRIKITGISREEFTYGATQYLTHHPTELKARIREKDHRNGFKKRYKSEEEAFKSWIDEKQQEWLDFDWLKKAGIND